MFASFSTDAINFVHRSIVITECCFVPDLSAKPQPYDGIPNVICNVISSSRSTPEQHAINQLKPSLPSSPDTCGLSYSRTTVSSMAGNSDEQPSSPSLTNGTTGGSTQVGTLSNNGFQISVPTTSTVLCVSRCCSNHIVGSPTETPYALPCVRSPITPIVHASKALFRLYRPPRTICPSRRCSSSCSTTQKAFPQLNAEQSSSRRRATEGVRRVPPRDR